MIGQMTIDFSPATRKSHPDTSRIAEDTITTSGKRQRHCQIILGALKKHNGSTTKELAEYLRGVLTYSQIHKRMSDLAENEYIERDSKIKRNGCSTWYLI